MSPLGDSYTTLTESSYISRIISVYRHIFQVEEASPGQTKRHALQYTDVLTHSIELLDL